MSKIEDWKVGDKGVIVSDNWSGHNLMVGETVDVLRVDEEESLVCAPRLGTEVKWIDLRDIKKVDYMEGSKRKYRICDILGVDVGQEFCVKYRNGNVRIFVNENGDIDSQFENQYDIDEVAIYAINHPESITICVNEEDKEYAKKIYDVFGNNGIIERTEDGLLTFSGIIIQDSGFKNLKPGDSVKLFELIDIS